jgi:hypothetical protein
MNIITNNTNTRYDANIMYVTDGNLLASFTASKRKRIMQHSNKNYHVNDVCHNLIVLYCSITKEPSN